VTVVLPDEDVPLDAAPNTGDNTLLYLIFTLTSFAALVCVATCGRKRKVR
jgi:hypothetical protein